MKKNIVIVWLLLSALLASNVQCKKDRTCEGCQTNSPIDTTSPGNTNKAPIAAAGPDQTITLPIDSVLLDGSASNDPEGKITQWLWTKISGPSSFVVVDPNNSKTQVKNLTEGIYLFELRVTDSGALYAKDTLMVTVEHPIIAPDFSGVYIAGWGKNTNGNEVARVWNNGVVQNLSDGQNNARAYSVAVSGNDVYVAGYDGNDAVIWKNGVAQILGNGEARSVCISGNDVYVGGKMSALATLWKNGLAQSFGNGEAVSVSVSGNDVYVAGWLPDGPGRSIVLWKNGLVQTLGNSISEGNELTSVFASGSDVYMAGNSFFTLSFGAPVVWVNGVENYLGPGEGRANSVFKFGNDVYVAGMLLGGNQSARAVIWKNGLATYLTNGQTDFVANSVFVSNNSVYATGGKYQNNGNASALWINGTEYIISGFTEANCIFVQ